MAVGLWLRLLDDALVLVVLAWSGLCVSGVCGWDACTWTDAGPAGTLPAVLLGWQRVQAMGLIWAGSCLALLSSLAQAAWMCR